MESEPNQDLPRLENGVSGYWEADALSLQFRPSSIPSLTNISYSELTTPVSWPDILPENECRQVVDVLRKASEHLQSFSFDTRIKMASGGERWVRVVGDSPRGDTLRGFITDFTASKTAELDAAERHKESSDRLTLLTSIAGTVIGSLEFEEQVRVMADQIRQAFQVDTCVVRVFVDGDLEMLAGSGGVVSSLPSKISAETGLAKLVLDSKTPFAVVDSREAECDVQPGRSQQFVSYAGAPLKVKDRVLGVISLSTDREVRRFSDGDLAHLQIVANSVAVAVFNNELYIQRAQRDREMEAVAAISLALREVESTEEMLPILGEQISNILESQSIGLALVDSDSDSASVRHVTGVFKNLQGVRFEKHQGFMGSVIMDAAPKFSSDLMGVPNSVIGATLDEPTAVLGVPLVAHGEVIGVIWLGKPAGSHPREEEFTEAETRLLGVLAEIAAASLRRAALRERTEFHLRRLHSLSIIHATVSENHNLRTTLDMLIEQLRSQTGIDAAAIHLYEEASASFRLETSAGFGQGMVVPSLGRDLIVNRYRSKLSDLQETGTRGRRFGAMIAAGFESYLAVPLIANENIVGVLEIYHKTELPQDVDLDNFVEMLASQAAIAVDNATLLKSLRTANRELIAAYDATIEGWARALDLRDHETEGHSRRVTDMTVELAKLVGVQPHQISHMRRGALLHDIGKMAIPDSVLHKPGELDQNELVIMRRHPGIALNLLEPVSFLKEAIDIPFCHHEKWDGTGYPRGLKENQIPLSARIFAVVDVWDALRSDRPYRKRWSIEQAVHYVRVQSGRQFDPDIVEVFLNNIDKFDYWDK